VERFKLIFRRQPHSLYWLAYGVAVGFFVWTAAQFYLPGKGFTGLIYFGGNPELHRIRELQALDYYVDRDTKGYDGQYYAQIAVKPVLTSRDLRAAMDNLPYRARRILFCWTAYLLGLGQPNLILQAYALQNILCWLLLAWLLLRWFPPTNLSNLVRWAGTMFAWGLTMSVREALMDGPSLLLIAWGVALAEQGRRWSSACVLGVAGLGRETNLLTALVHAPAQKWNWREVLGAAGRGLLVAAPLALWVAYLWSVFGEPSIAGGANLAAPFTAYFAKWFNTLVEFQSNGWDSSAKWTILLLVSMTVQFLVLLLRPQWANPWWRIGAPFAMLMIFLGEAVWAGFPGAAPRVVLPMTLAFNVLLPRGRWWWPVLILGNLSVLTAADQLTPPGRESFRLEGPLTIWRAPDSRAIDITFSQEWYQDERSNFEYWRWSRGSAGIVIHNPQAVAVEIEMDFDLRAFDARTIRVFQGQTLRWEGRVGRESAYVRLPHIRLDPGGNPWHFEADGPPSRPDGNTLRPVTFNLRNLVIRVVRKLDDQLVPDATQPRER